MKRFDGFLAITISAKHSILGFPDLVPAILKEILVSPRMYRHFLHSTHITESSAIAQNDWAITSPHACSLKSARISVIIEKSVTTSNLNGMLVYPF